LKGYFDTLIENTPIFDGCYEEIASWMISSIIPNFIQSTEYDMYINIILHDGINNNNNNQTPLNMDPETPITPLPYAKNVERIHVPQKHEVCFIFKNNKKKI